MLNPAQHLYLLSVPQKKVVDEFEQKIVSNPREKVGN